MTIQTFRAGPNGSVGQTGIPNAAYTAMDHLRTDFNYAGVKGYDTGSEWVLQSGVYVWKPQPGPIEWKVQAWVSNFGAQPYVPFNLVINIFKNGVDFWADLGGEEFSSFPNTGWVTNDGGDVAVEGDTYQPYIFMTTIDGTAIGQINADPRHVKMWGRSFGSL